MSLRRAPPLIVASASLLLLLAVVAACGEEDAGRQRTLSDVAPIDAFLDDGLGKVDATDLSPGEATGCVLDPGTGILRYRVCAGDTLSGIAERVYGDAGLWREIARANKGVVDEQGAVRVGAELVIPFAGR